MEWKLANWRIISPQKLPPLVFLDHRIPGPQFNAEYCNFADHDDNADSAFLFHELFKARLLGCEVIMIHSKPLGIGFGFL